MLLLWVRYLLLPFRSCHHVEVSDKWEAWQISDGIGLRDYYRRCVLQVIIYVESISLGTHIGWFYWAESSYDMGKVVDFNDFKVLWMIGMMWLNTHAS